AALLALEGALERLAQLEVERARLAVAQAQLDDCAVSVDLDHALKSSVAGLPRSSRDVRMDRARMSNEEVQLSARSWRIARLALFGAIALWPVCWGWSVLHALGAAAFMLLFVWLPGRALVAWTYRPGSVLERILLGWVAGFALLGIAFVAC